MKAEQVERVAKWVERDLHIPCVVVGGSAIERLAPVGTKDVDLLIAVGDWAPLDSALEHRHDATPLEPLTGTIRGTTAMVGSDRIDVEFVSGEPFCGRRDPDDFIDYVRRRRSVLANGIRYSSPGVVFYMRLSIDDDWKWYVHSVVRDLTNHERPVPLSALDETVAVARHFGRRTPILERVRWVRQQLELFDDGRIQ